MDLELTSHTHTETQEDQSDHRIKIIAMQTEILELQIERNIGKLPRRDIASETKEIEMLIEQGRKKIKYYTSTSELNADTQQAFDEIMNGMIETEEELSDKLSATSRRLAKAKESLSYILNTYYPDVNDAMREILNDLERASSAENEEDRYREVSGDVVAVLNLHRSLCIEEHPTKPSFYKLAPI